MFVWCVNAGDVINIQPYQYLKMLQWSAVCNYVKKRIGLWQVGDIDSKISVFSLCLSVFIYEKTLFYTCVVTMKCYFVN